VSAFLTFIARIPWILPYLAAGIMGFLGYQERMENEIAPLDARRIQLEGDVEKTKQEVLSVKKFQEEKENLLKEYASLEQAFKAAKGQFPTNINLPELMEKFEIFAKELGIKITQFTPDTNVQRNLLSSSKISLRIHGTYVRGMQFLSALARMERVVNIESVKFASPRAESSGQVLDIEIAMQTYFVGDT
jgi:Tfp pilus assembly protein PilO